MSQAWIDSVGWAATAAFVASYFFPRASQLRAAQMLGAALWLGYGLLLHAPPVIVANVLVLVAAAWTAYRARTNKQPQLSQSP